MIHCRLCLALIWGGLMSFSVSVEGSEASGPERDSYGGVLALKASGATGYFHLEEINGRPYLITPEGHGYVALGINHFHTMTRTDYDAVIDDLKSWGFNAGCYQGPRFMWDRFPYTKGINLVRVSSWKSGEAFAFEDVFDPEFLERLEEQVREIVQPQAGNKMLIGYFLTDIPLWEREKNGQGWISFYQSLPETSAGGKVWRQWKADHPGEEDVAFLAVIARQIYARGHAFIRKYDPNHLIFSDRYHEVDIPEHVVREALPFVDAIAIQPTSKEFNRGFYDGLSEKYGKPIYIADHVSSFATGEYPVTMGQKAPDEESYLAYYQRYVLDAFSHPYLIGYNKCQYVNDPGAKMLKQGLVNADYTPYDYVAKLKEIHEAALKRAYADGISNR
jgi:hypothetical protein